MSTQPPLLPQRRSFLTRVNAGLASLAAVAVGRAAAQENPSASARWEAARHEKDDWFDKLGGKHRLVFDTTTAASLGEALLFGNNFIRANQTDYGLQSGDLAIVIVVRHRATPFGYNDAMWAKYGATLAGRINFQDPKTKEAPKANVYNFTGYGPLLSNGGTTLASLSQHGVQYAVCSMATRFYAGSIASATGGNVDHIYEELVANLVSTSRMVPAGIVAVNRAQERGYSLVSP